MIQLGILNLNQQIIQINETRVSPLAGDQILRGLQITSWLIKEGSGSLALGLLALGIVGFTLFHLCQFRRQQARDRFHM